MKDDQIIEFKKKFVEVEEDDFEDIEDVAQIPG
jgi:hypothetical protein